MAMTTAEKVRAFRARKKKEKSAQLRSAQAHAYVRTLSLPFFEYMMRNGNTDDFDQVFDMMGMDAPQFVNDSGPASALGILEDLPEIKERVFPEDARSLDRAELMIACLLDAAAILAGIVQSYKLTEIDARIAEVATTNLLDPETRDAAVSRLITLGKMKDHLAKEVRWKVPQWRLDQNLFKA